MYRLENNHMYSKLFFPKVFSLKKCFLSVFQYVNFESEKKKIFSIMFRFCEKATKIWSYLPLRLYVTKGQIISKCLFGVFNFFQKTNEYTSHSSKNRIHSFVFWKNSRLDNLLSKLTDL